MQLICKWIGKDMNFMVLIWIRYSYGRRWTISFWFRMLINSSKSAPMSLPSLPFLNRHCCSSIYNSKDCWVRCWNQQKRHQNFWRKIILTHWFKIGVLTGIAWDQYIFMKLFIGIGHIRKIHGKGRISLFNTGSVDSLIASTWN